MRSAHILPLAAMPQKKMNTRQFKFKTDYYSINGIYNIPGLVICSGHGYDFKTFCCKNCGEIFVVDLQSMYFEKTDIETLSNGKTCPKCNDNLKTSLIDYPENIFYNGTVLKNNNTIDKLNFEKIELKDTYVLN